MTRATVIAYHAVGDCPIERDPHRLVLSVKMFEQHMEFLARHREVVPLADVVDGRVRTQKPAVAITFDDAYRGVLTHAAPILARHGFSAVCFVPTAWVGRHNEWDPLGPTDCRLDVMTQDELLALETYGVRVESHAHAHANLADADDAAIRADLAQAQERFAEVMGRPARYLAYPYGRSAPARLVGAARDAGFEAAFTVNLPAGGKLAMERVNIRREDGMRFYALKTSGRYLALRHSWLGRTAYRAVRPLMYRDAAKAGV